LVAATGLEARADTLLEAPGGITILDNYAGGLDTYPNSSAPPSDVIGTNLFAIDSATISRSADKNTLTVTIHTNFAGAANTDAADGTTYGSLFITPKASELPGKPAGVAPYTTDTYTPNQWTYAVTVPQNGNVQTQGSTITGTSGAYAIGAVTGTNFYTQNGADGTVPVSYKTQNGTIVMSNAYTDPVTYPNPGNPYFYFRQGQAVQYTPDQIAAAAFAAGYSITATTWTTNPDNYTDGVVLTEGSITFSITDNDALGDNFELAWAMTCGNDVYQAILDFGPAGGPPNQTPLPASVLMMGSVLGAGGLLARLRRRVKATPAV
jgi:hypothetical protein